MPPKVVTAFNPDMNGYYEDIKSDNGDVYTGDFVAGYYDSVYDGQWKDDMPNGQGKYTSADGSVIEGTWIEEYTSVYKGSW